MIEIVILLKIKDIEDGSQTIEVSEINPRVDIQSFEKSILVGKIEESDYGVVNEIGRFNIRTPQELTNLVQKVIINDYKPEANKICLAVQRA